MFAFYLSQGIHKCLQLYPHIQIKLFALNTVQFGLVWILNSILKHNYGVSFCYKQKKNSILAYHEAGFYWGNGQNHRIGFSISFCRSCDPVVTGQKPLPPMQCLAMAEIQNGGPRV